MSTYMPLAYTVFGNSNFIFALRESLQSSLVDSRLFFNGHVVVPDVAFIRIMNQSYVRVVRKRLGCSRYDGTAESDELVRKRYSIPSVDCILQKKRLAYLARLILCRPKSLITLLHATRCECRLPWTRFVLQDMSFLRGQSLPWLPCPVAGYLAWVEYITADPGRWKEITSSLHYTCSCLDASATDTSVAVHALRCQLCDTGRTFASTKALLQHQRTKHGVRNPKRYLISDGVCPACQTDH